MLKLNIQQEDKLMELESRSRCENVRIYGVPEGAESECATTTAFIESLLCKGLKFATIWLTSILKVWCSLWFRPPEDAPPRSIIVKFPSFKKKEAILHEA